MREDVAHEIASALPSEYVLLNKDGTEPDGPPVPIGEGGSSVVFRALYRGYLDRAIKLMVPRDDLRENQGTGLFVSSFDNETGALASLNHEHIARLTDIGAVHLSGNAHPFVVTEYIDGISLEKFCLDDRSSGRDIMTGLHQVLSALVYMHGRGIMHCDLKPDNILVRAVGSDVSEHVSAVVVDLGVSHRIDPRADVNEKHEYTYFFSTPRYVISQLKPYLGNESNNRIQRSELRKCFPWQDLHSFGVILEELLSNDVIRNKLRLYVGRTNIDALIHMREKLKNPRPGTLHYASALEARIALERVPFSGIAPLGLPELAPVPEKGVVLPTSRSRVPGSERVDSVISHPLFQRLHNLPQLDLLHFVLPGATHTRFVHALHTYDLARIAICQQLGNWNFRLNVDIADINCSLFAALLDSVGRYHFQHMFEDFIVDRKQVGLRGAGLLSDRELLDAMMGNGDANAPSGLADLRDGAGRTLSDVVENCANLSWGDLRQRMTNPSTPVQGFLAGLLSSPVDVDKLAYLIDDSAFSGLPFGQAVAPGPVFEALRVPNPDDWARLPVPRVAVALREKALSYVEQSVLSRYWNIQTGYWYRTNRSLQAMVKYQIYALLKTQSLQFGDFVRGTLHLSADGALRWLDRAFKAAIQSGGIDDATVDPLEGLLISNREIYKRLVTISPKSLLDSRAQDRFIYQGLIRRSPLEDDKVCDSVARILEGLKAGLRVRPGEVLLDLPRFRREEMGGKMLVYADSPGPGLLGELSTISPLLAGLQQQFDLYAKRLRIFIHPRVYRELDGIQKDAHEAVLDMLRAEFDGGIQ